MMIATFHPHLATTPIPPLTFEADDPTWAGIAILNHVARYEDDRPGLAVTVHPDLVDGCVWYGPHSADLGWRITIDADRASDDVGKMGGHQPAGDGDTP